MIMLGTEKHEVIIFNENHLVAIITAIPTYVSNATQETCIGCVGQVTCEIYGYPRPNVTAWTKNGNIITSNSRLVFICV